MVEIIGVEEHGKNKKAATDKDEANPECDGLRGIEKAIGEPAAETGCADPGGDQDGDGIKTN